MIKFRFKDFDFSKFNFHAENHRKNQQNCLSFVGLKCRIVKQEVSFRAIPIAKKKMNNYNQPDFSSLYISD